MDYDYEMKKIVITLLVIALLVGTGLFVMNKKDNVSSVDQPSTQNRMMSIDNYVKIYISELSPMPEVLGGTFYVTLIETNNGRGVVSYEDGHNAYTADFTYTEKEGSVLVTSFVVRE